MTAQDLFGDGEQFTTMVIENSYAAAKEPERVILERVRRYGYSEDAVFALRLGMEEAMTNAIKHGNKCDPARKVRVHFDITPQRAIVVVADEGPGFCPADVPDCTAETRISRPDGRGIMLMNAYLDEVAYSKSGNAVRMVKRNT